MKASFGPGRGGPIIDGGDGASAAGGDTALTGGGSLMTGLGGSGGAGVGGAASFPATVSPGGMTGSAGGVSTCGGAGRTRVMAMRERPPCPARGGS